MSTSENLLLPLPSVSPLLLDLDTVNPSSTRMCYNNDDVRLTSQGVVTYSPYMRGSILSVPKLWQVDNRDTLVVSVYSFLKTFLR